MFNHDRIWFTMHATFNQFWVICAMRRASYYFILALLSFFILTLSSCSSTVDPADAYSDESPDQIFERGKQSLRDHGYQNAMKRFEALEVQYPFGHNTPMAQLYLVYIYYMTGEYLSAEKGADRFIHNYPTHPNIDYVYYMRGLASFNKNLGVFEKIFTVDLATRDLAQIKKSYKDFTEVDENYPNSIYAPPAHQYRIYLRNVMANHELDVARYYFSRGAYVAAANRASRVVNYYEQAPAVPPALVLMVKSYRYLGLTANANEALRVLEYNYPNSDYVKEAVI